MGVLPQSTFPFILAIVSHFLLENYFSLVCHFGGTVSPILSYPRNGHVTRSLLTRHFFPRFWIFILKGKTISLKEMWVGFCHLDLQGSPGFFFVLFSSPPFHVCIRICIIAHPMLSLSPLAQFLYYRGWKLKLHFPDALAPRAHTWPGSPKRMYLQEISKTVVSYAKWWLHTGGKAIWGNVGGSSTVYNQRILLVHLSN